MINFLILTAAIFVIFGSILGAVKTKDFIYVVAGGIAGACVWFFVFLLVGLLFTIVR